MLVGARTLPAAAQTPDERQGLAAAGPSIAISLADRRLYLTGADGTTRGFPVAIGRPGVPIPVGDSSIQRKRRDPTWRPTANQRREKPSLPRAVPPGPNNPLGKFALDLGWPAIAIHGTNDPDSVGRQASGGCFRMLPADIETVFATAEVGTPVRVVRGSLGGKPPMPVAMQPAGPLPVAVKAAPAAAGKPPKPSPSPANATATAPAAVPRPPTPEPPPQPEADPRCATVTAPLRRMICDVPALALLDGRARGAQERFLAGIADPAARAAAAYDLIQEDRRFHERIAALCWIRSGTEGDPAVAASARSCLATALDHRLDDVAERIATLRGGAMLAGRP
ncbi:L,D-transpeptidase (plasmid) [Azospirillum humicireducens]|uniref:L,D-transpeptidase n=1 Tax=Azospirillum humicireducens TaxID=1226968 RepID=A0A2R4VTJ8_9PROT|nr:L,D-transpeptidase [Azospirillum humicireducens]